ncbi:glycosyltransferase [Nocardia stercoris]|uniref:Glycosyltransferase n=1 Tax=Nocardia stercoris TaxID=2483361 RepID=A0A3M2L7D2_9NOCA|nr:glycosyltransferase [Nocardia stercoris]RMI32630.1 glycosyltransferase [Nocardia stercoris]
MKALLVFGGSRGDVQPGVLVAKELMRRGHEVQLAVPPNFVEFAAENGVTAAGCGMDTRVSLHSDTEIGNVGPIARLRSLREQSHHGFDTMAADLLALDSDADLVVGGLVDEEVARGVAARIGAPAFAVLHFYPVRPSRTVAVLPNDFGTRIPGALNKAAWKLGLGVRALDIKGQVDRLEAGRPAPAELAIQVYDDKLFPGLRQEWGGRNPFVGFVTPPAGYRVADEDTELTRWLDAGSAPVYVGFGSMPIPDLGATVDQIQTACRRFGRRMLFVGGWNEVEDTCSGDVAMVRSVDHATVLPRCAAVVHHGGAGTTAAALRAGVPSVVCSFLGDQKYWGHCLRELKIGAVMSFSRLSAATMTAALEEVLAPECAERAARFAVDFEDDGAPKTVDLLERFVAENVPARKVSG